MDWLADHLEITVIFLSIIVFIILHIIRKTYYKNSSLNITNASLTKQIHDKEIIISTQEKEIHKRDAYISSLKTFLLSYGISTSTDYDILRELRFVFEENKFLKEKNYQLSKNYQDLQNYSLDFITSHPQFSIWNSDTDLSRFHHTLSEKIQIDPNMAITANVHSSGSGETYTTTLTSCSCRDFKYNTHGKPCKHMYALAWHIGIIRETAPHRLYNEYQKYAELRTEVKQTQEEIRKIVNTRSQRSPWLAKQLADYQYERDVKVSDYLNSTNSRIRKTDELKRLAKEKRDIAQERNMLQNQLSYLYTMIPWLEEYITTPPKKDVIEDPSDNPEWDTMKYYLSADEYNKLTTTEKYQLALDRYNKRKKNAWEIGIDFERYIGSTYENKGYKVQYRGAIDGLEDMGRDVIAEGNGITYIIQCKRWSAHKTIHEKHIFQLYGSSILYMLDHPCTDVRPLFVTTTTLSERASAIAKYLNVRVRENTEIKDYPQIKCNIGKSGEKIYHLPFDQQYDHIVISPEKGEFYCMTVAEAESLGFRRAKKWLGTDSQI